MLLIAAGGVIYTIGAAIYAKKGFKYHHLVWHLFIDLAAASHFVAIVFFL
jgi:hemolysin III